MLLTVGGGKVPAPAEVRTAVLEAVALLRQRLDAGIFRNDFRDFRSDRSGAIEVEPVRDRRSDSARELQENLPLGTRLTNPWSIDLGAEDDAPLGGGFG